jgi:tetratricopeptide (TPR) repeat protein
MKVRFFSTAILSIFLVIGQTWAEAEEPRVRAWFEDVVIPTYNLDPDDVNPRFFELENTIIYPYTMQDNLTTTKTDRTYRAAFLENEYLRVMCLPEIGGRIQSVYDKRRGEEMFYHNHVIKPGLIALRGAWVSGGIEWNRGPTGHTVTSFSPVDVVTVENPDGSASLIIGNTEMNFRTVWTVRLTLHPGRAYLDEQISIANPTDGFHSYYFWNNTAFPNRPGTRFVYPMTLGSDHDGAKFFSWPVHQGRDLTWLENYPDPTSIFAYECEYDFFGAYDVDRDYGIVQVANHHVIPGKKAWTWGQADYGLARQSVLTDEDGPYIEVQSGPLPTQADYGFLTPGQSIAWQEWWCPVFGLGRGFEYATKDVAVERIVHEDGVELRMIATAAYPSAEVVITREGEALLSKPIDLSPSETVSLMVPAPPTDPVEIAISTKDGFTLLKYTSPLDVAARHAPALPDEAPLDSMSVEEIFLRGQKFDRQTNRVEARNLYERALEKDPGHTSTLVALAVLDAEAGRYDAASKSLEKALARDPRNGLAAYLLGVMTLNLGELTDSVRLGYQATKLHTTGPLGYDLVGRAKMRQGDMKGALEAFTKGYASGRIDGERLFEQKLLAHYATGDLDTARDLAKKFIAKGTTRLVPHALLALMGDPPLGRFAEAARETVGEDEFTFLELAIFFADLGLCEEAIRLIEATTIQGVPDEKQGPIPHYYLAFYASKHGLPADAQRFLKTASELSPDYVFPSRPETIAVLEYALEQNPGDARAHLYLGNLLAGLGRLTEAVSHWEKAASKEPTLSVAHRNLGLYAWKVHQNLEDAAEHYSKAIAARPPDQVLYRDLARIRVAQGNRAEAIRLLENIPLDKRRRGDVTTLLARTYINDKRYDEALELLASDTFSNWEGDSDVRSLFSGAHITRGILLFDETKHEEALDDFQTALTYPENLNVGRPSKPQEARALYWKGKALTALGRVEEARRAWDEGAHGHPGREEQNEHIEKCRLELKNNEL